MVSRSQFANSSNGINGCSLLRPLISPGTLSILYSFVKKNVMEFIEDSVEGWARKRIFMIKYKYIFTML